MAFENKLHGSMLLLFDVLTVSLEPQEASKIQIRNQNYMHQEI